MGMTEIPPGFDSPCVVELMGRRRVVGRVREAEFPAGFLRIDEPDGRTSLASPQSIYALHPVTAEVAQALAEKWRTDPVTRWDLPDEWRQAIAAAPAEPAEPAERRCLNCDHQLAAHNTYGCGHEMKITGFRCGCRVTVDPWGDGDGQDDDDGVRAVETITTPLL